MANTYYFKINAVDAHVNQEGLENVVYNVHWSYYGEDGNGNVASQIGVQHVPYVDPENFTPFDQLTQADVISWIEPELNVAEFQINLDAQLSEMATPTMVTLQVPESLGAATNEEIV